VAVKRALIKPTLFPVLEAVVRLRSTVPMVIAARNPNNNTCGGDSFFSFTVLISDIVLYLVFLNLTFNLTISSKIPGLPELGQYIFLIGLIAYKELKQFSLRVV